MIMTWSLIILDSKFSWCEKKFSVVLETACAVVPPCEYCVVISIAIGTWSQT